MADCLNSFPHQHPHYLEGEVIPIEPMMVDNGDHESLINVVADASLFVQADNWLAAPGVVFPGLVARYFPDVQVKHIMWTEPHAYPMLSSLNVEGAGTIHWLLGLPITDREYAHLQEYVLML